MPKETIATRWPTGGQFIRKVDETYGAEWARKRPWVIETAMEPDWEKIAFFERWITYDKMFKWGFDMENNPMLKMFLYLLRCRSAAKIVAPTPEMAQPADISQRLIFSNQDKYTPGLWDITTSAPQPQERSRNEDRAEERAGRERQKRAELIPALQSEITRMREEMEQKDREMKRLRKLNKPAKHTEEQEGEEDGEGP